MRVFLCFLVALSAVGVTCGTSWAQTDLIWEHPDTFLGTTDDAQAVHDALVANGIDPGDIVTVPDILVETLANYDRVWALLGTYFDTMIVTNHEMTVPEGQALADYLSIDNGNLYLSSNDYFFFDDPVPLNDWDGVVGLADGQSDVTDLAGLDSGTGLDLSGFPSLLYTGETVFNDEIGPDPANAGAGLLWMDNSTTDPLGVYHDGNLSALGDFHVVNSSFEFGGIADGMARNDVMALFLAALRYVPPPEDIFERGDANGDTMVNIADANYIFNFLFVQGPVPPCDDAADANDDSTINIADGSYILNYLFVMGSPPPPPPFGACDEDPSSDMLRCGAPCP